MSRTPFRIWNRDRKSLYEMCMCFQRLDTVHAYQKTYRNIYVVVRIETAFPIAAKNGLGWGPVQTSRVLGSICIVILATLILATYLSSKKVSDKLLVAIGNLLWVIGGISFYFLWTDNGAVWQYVLPVIVCCSGLSFVTGTNRSIYTEAVARTPELDHHRSLMQAVLSMSNSVAGFL